MNPSVYFQVYASSATNLFSELDLQALLRQCRENNTALGITGMLLYKDGNFMQVLEGDETVIRQLLARIRTDPRHAGMMTLLEGSAPREFPDWSMGFQDLQSAESRAIPGYHEFMNIPLNDASFSGNPSAARRLLLTFRRVVR